MAFVMPVIFPFHQSTGRVWRYQYALKFFRKFQGVNYTLESMDMQLPDPVIQGSLWHVIGDRAALKPILIEFYKNVGPNPERIAEMHLEHMAKRFSADEGETLTPEEEAELNREIPEDQILCE